MPFTIVNAIHNFVNAKIFKDSVDTFLLGCRADRFTIVNAIHNFVNPIHNPVNAIHKKIEKNLDRHSLREKVVEDSGREK